MPFLVGLFLCYCWKIIVESFIGNHPELTIYWCFQLPGILFIGIALQIVWVDKIRERANTTCS
jgi:hypothetical protein